MYVVGMGRKYIVTRDVQNAPAEKSVLLVGAVETEDEVDELTAAGYDVAEQLHYPVAIATHDGFNVRDFGAVVVYAPSMDSSTGTGTALILQAEAHAHGVPVITTQSATDCAPCGTCRQYQTVSTARDASGAVVCVACFGDAPGCACGMDGVTEPVFLNGAWDVQCRRCTTITKAAFPSPWNVERDDAAAPADLFGIRA
ncbi:hypothetical protein [Streptomyces sp. NPDC048560]|uniref:hypothetical protein n=1 Tax=Streptomyces sp. NPDC048560 TaxID=3155488 RepID=UPI003423B4EB